MTIKLMTDSTAEEIGQNIRTIAAVPQGSLPLARALGIDATLADQPGTRGKALLTASLFDVLPRYEPRARVNRITMVDGEGPGRVDPVIDYTLEV